jgi:Pyridoxamine 5'-phosphate oxidase
MASFADVEAAEPEFARLFRTAFDAHRHKVLATLRADGSPRVSGIEAQIKDGELWLAGMPASVKFADLRRDPRMALHSGSDDPERFTADAKVSGRTVEITDPAGRAAFAGPAEEPAEDAGPSSFELFRVEIDQLVLTGLNEEKTALVISSWHPGRGVTRAERT